MVHSLQDTSITHSIQRRPLPTYPLALSNNRRRPAVKMGRKKIIIKRLTEDRNRNVTFLKASIRCALTPGPERRQHC
jgi:hypothetical protein